MTPISNSHSTWRDGLVALAICAIYSGPALAQTFTTEVPGTSGFHWVNTGRYLSPNTSVRLQATGSVNYGSAVGTYSPIGTGSLGFAYGFPSPGPRKYNLAARLTASSTNPDDELRETDQAYGVEDSFCARHGGNLWLTANDDQPDDNTGAYSVEVTLGTCGADPLPPPPPAATADLRVTGMEVTQATQVYPGTPLPLVGYKRTVVRVYVQVTGDTPWSDVTGRLTIRNISGTHLGHDITGRFILPSTGDSRSAITATPAGSSRDTLTDSLNFVLDLDQTAPGERELDVQVSTVSGRPETDATNNRLVQRVRFGPALVTTIFGTTYGNRNTSPTCRYVDPDDVVVPFAHFYPHRRWAENLYPVSQFFILPLPGVPDDHLFDNSGCDAQNASHAWTARHLARLRPGGGARAYVLGPLPRYGYDGWCCTFDARNQVARGTDSQFDPGPTLSHEIGHSFGRAHTWEDAMFPYSANSYGGNVGMRTNAGLYASTLQALPGRAADGSILRGDIMSYVAPFWISPYTYCALMTAISSGSFACSPGEDVGTLEAGTSRVSLFGASAAQFGSSDAVDAAQLVSAASGGYPYLYVASHPGGCNTPEFEPFDLVYLSKDIPTMQPGGECSIALADANGSILAEFGMVGGPHYYGDFEPRSGMFIPWRSEARSVLMLRNGKVILSRNVSANAPEVRLESAAFDGPASGTRAIQWSASDADGDELMYAVDFSADGGKTWIPVASGLRETKTTIDFDRLPGTKIGLLRVAATDGVNTTEAVMKDPFVVASKAPSIQASFAGQKELVAKPGDTLALNASAFDWEDGPITDIGAYRWFIGEKQVGSGPWINLSGMVPGLYDLKLAVNDSEGNTSQVSTSVLVTDGK